MDLVNLCRHEIRIYDRSGSVLLHRLASAGVCTVEEVSTVVGSCGGIPVVAKHYGAVRGLPARRPGTVYVVGRVVAQVLAGARDDVLAPDTGLSGVRDRRGRIIGVTGFLVIGPSPLGAEEQSGDVLREAPGLVLF